MEITIGLKYFKLWFLQEGDVRRFQPVLARNFIQAIYLMKDCIGSDEVLMAYCEEDGPLHLLSVQDYCTLFHAAAPKEYDYDMILEQGVTKKVRKWLKKVMDSYIRGSKTTEGKYDSRYYGFYDNMFPYCISGGYASEDLCVLKNLFQDMQNIASGHGDALDEILCNHSIFGAAYLNAILTWNGGTDKYMIPSAECVFEEFSKLLQRAAWRGFNISGFESYIRSPRTSA